MKYSVVFFVLGLVATLAMVVNISCSTRNQEQNLATKIRRKMQEEQIRLTDLGFNIWSKTITNDVVWKDNDGKLLDVSRGGKISYIDGIFWWVGRKPSSSSNVSIRQYYTYTYTYCVHLLLVAFTPTRTCPPKIIPILSITMEETLFSHICDHSKLLLRLVRSCWRHLSLQVLHPWIRFMGVCQKVGGKSNERIAAYRSELST